MQVDGYSLEAQKERLMRYAEYENMLVVGEYSDEGKSGKNTEGRPEFLQMLNDIETGKDNIEYVLVFKLSRFGRNAADVLSSLQKMQDFGVNLICVEDGIDSSKDSGKLMISVLSAVAEIERENILIQTMEGRRQKAREGKWNGGFAPYGYELKEGKLIIAEDEAEAIRVIYDKYIHTRMGINAVADYLNNNGFIKKKRQNNTLEAFSASFVKAVLDNPVYCGKLAYGRRKTEKIQGTRNQFHVVRQQEFPVYNGIHDGIVSEEIWNEAHKKRSETGVANEKTHSLEHANILSGILKCPICGSSMYGNVNRKRKKDGSRYKDYFYYSCKHRLKVDGHKCDYKKQWGQDKVNAAVAEIIKHLVQTPKFEEAIREKINSKINTDELNCELKVLKKNNNQLIGAKNRLAEQIDRLDTADKLFEKKYEDMQSRLDKLYTEIDLNEAKIDEINQRIENIKNEKISGDNIYQFLMCFDKLYDRFTDMEKKQFMNSFIEKIEIYEEVQPDGRFIKEITFKFPVFLDGKEVNAISWDNETTVETCVLLSKLKSSKSVSIELDLDDLEITAAEAKATYGEIKEYILNKYGFKVSSLNIAQVKQECGIIERENFNKPSGKYRQPKCPEHKFNAIKETLEHFKMI